MPRYVKKPIKIEAVRWTGDNHDEVHDLVGDAWGHTVIAKEPPGTDLVIETLEGVMTAQPGDWIIKGVEGEFYPCKPSIFDATYTLVERYETPG